MALIEQAVFTSAETERAAGYQLVAASPGIEEADARHLAQWGPSHGSMIGRGPEAVGFAFYPLPSGAYCAARSSAGGGEYSERGGIRVYTQCLVVPQEVLTRFSSNPFAVVRAAIAVGAMRLLHEIPPKLEPITLGGRAAAVDGTLLARLTLNPGNLWLATLVEALLRHDQLSITGGPASEQLIAGVLNLLPPECRTELSFSTGLRYSSRRPFRLVVLGDDRAEQRRMFHRHHLVAVDLDGHPPSEYAPIDGWSRFILQVLQSGQTAYLATQFAKRRFGLALADLPALGLQLLDQLDQTCLPQPEPPPPPSPRAAEAASEATDWLLGLPRAHAAHRRFEKSAPAAGGAATASLEGTSLADQEKLEKLDEIVFEAMAGKMRALAELRAIWPQLREELGGDLFQQSREQYLRHALAIWEECLDPEGIRDPSRAVAALDVLCTLFDEV